MRISDWSSDVCSSDLQRGRIGIGHDAFLQAEIIRAAPRGAAGHWRRLYAGLANGARGRAGQTKETPRPALPTPPPARSFRHARPPASGRGRRRDRKSVVSGKSVAVRVDIGGRRIIKKKKTDIQ